MENGGSSTTKQKKHVLVDVNALALFLTEEFNQLHPLSRERCIYRVPKRLRVLNEKAYTPQCVSIGPYHHGKDELKAMEEHKTQYLQHFLGYSKVSLHKFLSYVRDNETRLRNYYQERIDHSSEIFVRLMLVDTAFVIMLMLRAFSMEFHIKDELVHYKPWMICDIQSDMILLENQLPLFILHELLVLSNLLGESFSTAQISLRFLGNNIKSWVVNPLEMSEFSECKHLVDILRIGQQPLELNKHKPLDVVKLPSAVELHQAGVKFKRGSSQILADINFNFGDGILEIPQLDIQAKTEVLFRNLQAFEQTNIHFPKRYFNDYITIISLLITNEKDVEILTNEGIINNWLHSNEQVVHLFNNLNKGNLVSTTKFYFTDVVNGLNQYSSKRRYRWRASLIQNYFYSPGAIISVCAGAAVILLTIIQTFFSILQFVKQ